MDVARQRSRSAMPSSAIKVECWLIRPADEVVEPLDGESPKIEVRSHPSWHAVGLKHDDIMPGLGRMPSGGQTHRPRTDYDDAAHDYLLWREGQNSRKR
jgi:hypothetical protein